MSKKVVVEVDTDVEAELLRILFLMKERGFNTLLVCSKKEIAECKDKKFVKKAIQITLG